MDKPFKTIDEQIQILNSRGVLTNQASHSILEREGYYSVVNGYKDLFLDAGASFDAGSDRYADGTTLDDVYRLFKFDRDLRSTMMLYFSEAENHAQNNVLLLLL